MQLEWDGNAKVGLHLPIEARFFEEKRIFFNDLYGFLNISSGTLIKCLADLKLTIHLSFLVFRHVRALFCELFCKIANQSLYTSHNITDFVHLWFCEKLIVSSSLASYKLIVKLTRMWKNVGKMRETIRV